MKVKKIPYKYFYTYKIKHSHSLLNKMALFCLLRVSFLLEPLTAGLILRTSTFSLKTFDGEDSKILTINIIKPHIIIYCKYK